MPADVRPEGRRFPFFFPPVIVVTMADRDSPTSRSPNQEPVATLPGVGRLLGLDFGTKRVGVAVSDVEQRYAAPLTVFVRSSAKGDAAALLRLVAEYAVVGLIVGLPVHMSGDEGRSARLAREFGTWAGRVTGLPVVYWDERHTSTIAESHLLSAGLSEKKRKAKLDAVAAQIMLQSCLDTHDPDLWTPPSTPELSS
jgi:putative Holliday junction resolvase